MLRDIARILAGKRLLLIRIVATAAVLAGAGVLAAGLLRTPQGPGLRLDAEPPPDPSTVATPGTVTPGVDPFAFAPSPSRSSASSLSAPTQRVSGLRPALVARYSTKDVSLINYHASVAITNPGSAPVVGWTMAITLPRRTLSVTEVAGADARQDGRTWTFIPDQTTRQIPAGGSVEVRFRVDGAALGAAPTGCTVDDHPCEGTPS